MAKSVITCSSCGKQAELKAKNLCSACYQRLKSKSKDPRIRALKTCTRCDELKPYKGNGLCVSCHSTQTTQQRKQHLVTCTSCHQLKPKHARGICEACYDASRYEKRYGPKRRTPSACADCGAAAERYIKGSCPRCYNRWRTRNGPVAQCSSCKEFRPHVAHGLCRPCYSKAQPLRLQRTIICADCGASAQHNAWGLCVRCYNKAHKKVHQQYQRRRYMTDPEFRARVIHHVWKRKLLKRGLAANHTVEEWLSLLEIFDHRCAYCSCDIKSAPTKDHIVPLSKGGTDDIDNITPACHSCNSRKKDRSALEFIRLLHAEKLLSDPKG